MSKTEVKDDNKKKKFVKCKNAKAGIRCHFEGDPSDDHCLVCLVNQTFRAIGGLFHILEANYQGNYSVFKALHGSDHYLKSLSIAFSKQFLPRYVPEAFKHMKRRSKKLREVGTVNPLIR